METSTIRIAIRDLPAQFDRSRIGLVLDEIGAGLREERGVSARCSADSMTIEIDVSTARLGPAVAGLAAMGLLPASS
jgi:hypothetical protein